MISRKYETIVGLFVLASLVALLFMVLIIAQQEGLWQEYIEYKTLFRNISGLKRGSEVRLAGLTVGSVRSISVRPDGKIEVTFEVLGKYRDQIRQDSQASIGMIGLLGDRSLDLTAGSKGLPPIPEGGLVAAMEPLDFQEILSRAAPSLENIQRVLVNLEKVTEDMANPKGAFNQALIQIKETVAKINQGVGTLGLLVNDPTLYKEATQALASSRKLLDSLNHPQGALGMFLNDPAFRQDLQKIIKDVEVLAANLRQGSGPLSETLARLPAIAQKVEVILGYLERAGAGLPDLVSTGQGLVSDADKVAEAAKKTRFLKRHLASPKERTLRVEGELK